jgi:hypothetical protein
MGPKTPGRSLDPGAGNPDPGSFPVTGQGTGATDPSGEAWLLAEHQVLAIGPDYLT